MMKMNLGIGKTARSDAMLHGCAIAIALSLVCFAASGARGETKMPGPLFVGVQGGYSPENIGAFSPSLCTKKELLYEGYVGVRILRHLAVRTVLVHHDDFDAVCAETPPEPPIPQSGPYTVRRIEFGNDIARYPYYSSELDLVREPVSFRSIVSLRLLAGYGWIWTKDISFWTAGAGLAVGDERVRIIFDVKGSWFKVPYERVTYHYEDGVLVGRHAISQHTNEHPLAIIAGVEFGIPWFK
jgi:hypothetical protein